MASIFLSSPVSVRPSRLLRDEEDGRGDKEPAPPPCRLPFVALSPSLLVTHDYALSTSEQVLLFACNSMTISVNLCRGCKCCSRAVSFACVFYIWLAYTDVALILFIHIFSVLEDVLYSAYIYTVNNDLCFHINTYLAQYCSPHPKGKQLTVCTCQISFVSFCFELFSRSTPKMRMS